MDDEPPSKQHYLELKFCSWGTEMKYRNDPIKLGNNVLIVFDSLRGKRIEYVIPDNVRRTHNRVAVASGRIFLNGFELNQASGKWKRTFRAKVVEWALPGSSVEYEAEDDS